MRMNRMLSGIVLLGAFLTSGGHAGECKEVALYTDVSSVGNVVESNFPESPEWKTNWGNLDGMVPPYIRWSGMRNVRGDWTTLLSFSTLPATVEGGSLQLKVRVTQNSKFGVWLAGSFGKSSVYYVDIPANVTKFVDVPLSKVSVNGKVNVEKVGFGLFNVPQYQYTTMFIDDIYLTCGKNSANSGVTSAETSSEETAGYEFSDVNSRDAHRENRYLPRLESEFTAAYENQMRDSLLALTNANFVMPEWEHQKLKRNVEATSMTPKKSRMAWFDNLYSVLRNRVRESVVANPKNLFYEAEAIAAATDYTFMPILLANMDYAYEACTDTSCKSTRFLNARLLQAGLPSSFVRGSKLTLAYDPFFLTTTERSMPKLSVCVDGKCSSIAPKEILQLEFPSAGVQKIIVKLTDGNLTVNQNLFVEVK